MKANAEKKSSTTPDEEQGHWNASYSLIEAQEELVSLQRAQEKLDNGTFNPHDLGDGHIWTHECEQVAIDHDTARLKAVIAHHKAK